VSRLVALSGLVQQTKRDAKRDAKKDAKRDE
jgi:hypothetical protein